jgi:hypothetical protein
MDINPGDRPMGHHRNRVGCAVLAIMLLALPNTLEAQAPRFLNVMGYGALGGAVGLAMTADAECSDPGWLCIPAQTVLATLGGALAGMITGNLIASSANRTVEEGQPASSGAMTALTVGSVLGGAAVGLVVGHMLGGGDQALAITGLAGAALGVVQISRRRKALTGGSMELRPVVGGKGRVGVNLTLRF